MNTGVSLRSGDEMVRAIGGTLTVEARGLREYERLLQYAPEITTRAARMALNQTARGPGLKLLRRSVEEQAAFPPGYLELPGRLVVRRLATNNNLEASIFGQARATSLARFAGSSPFPTPRGSAVTVEVNPGVRKDIPGAFFVRLRAGKSRLEDNYNLGLAIRLKDGQTIRNKNKQSLVQLDHNVYILYGPSVDQIFADVSVEQSDSIADMAELEFSRQFARLAEEI